MLQNGAEDVFNDSLSQSLLPNQKGKRRERTQVIFGFVLF